MRRNEADRRKRYLLKEPSFFMRKFSWFQKQSSRKQKAKVKKRACEIYGFWGFGMRREIGSNIILYIRMYIFFEVYELKNKILEIKDLTSKEGIQREGERNHITRESKLKRTILYSLYKYIGMSMVFPIRKKGGPSFLCILTVKDFIG